MKKQTKYVIGLTRQKRGNQDLRVSLLIAALLIAIVRVYLLLASGSVWKNIGALVVPDVGYFALMQFVLSGPRARSSRRLGVVWFRPGLFVRDVQVN